MQTVEERLGQLERSVRRWRAVTLALVGVLVVGVTVAQTRSDVADVLRCKMLAVVDGQGNPRARLWVGENGPVLTLFDEQGNPRAALSVSEYGPSLNLADEQGELRAWLAVLKDGPSLSLCDEQGKGRAVIGVGGTTQKSGVETKYPESSIRLFGPDGSMSWSAP